MVIRSKLSVPIPTVSVPDFVFNSPDAPLPESPLLISAENPERFLSLSSYRDQSRRFAAGLKASGVKDGGRVFLVSYNTIYNAVVFMGTVMAGAIFSGVQATYSVADVARQLEQTDPKVVLAKESFMPKLVEACQVASRESQKIYLFDECLHSGPSHWTKLLLTERVAQDFTWESFQFQGRGNEDRLSHLLFREHWFSQRSGDVTLSNDCVRCAIPLHRCGHAAARYSRPRRDIGAFVLHVNVAGGGPNHSLCQFS